VTLSEDGRQRRDFIHVDDIVTANLLALKTNVEETLTFNLGTGIDTSLLEFVELAQESIKDRLGICPGKVTVTDSLQAGDVRHCKINVTGAQKHLQFQPGVTLQAGLAQWISEYESCFV